MPIQTPVDTDETEMDTQPTSANMRPKSMPPKDVPMTMRDDGVVEMGTNGNLDSGTRATMPSDVMMLLGAGKPYGENNGSK